METDLVLLTMAVLPLLLMSRWQRPAVVPVSEEVRPARPIRLVREPRA